MKQQSQLLLSMSLMAVAVVLNAAPVVCKGVVREVDNQSRIKLAESAGVAKECLEDLPPISAAQLISAGDAVEFSVDQLAGKSKEITGVKVTRYRLAVDARIDSIDIENGRVRIRQPRAVRAADKERLSRLFPEDGGIVVAGTTLRQSQAFKKLAEGDRIRLVIGVTPADRATAEIDDIRPLRVSDINGSGRAFWFLAAGAAVIALVALVASLFSPLLLLFVGIDNKTSKSKTQLSFWMIMIFTVLLATVFCRACFGLGFTGSIAMPTNLAILAGISGITFVSAKAIRTKVEREKAAAGVASTTADKATVADLVKDENGKQSLGDTQMLLVAAVAILIYVLQVHEFLAGMELTMSITLPDIDGSIATLFGVSQGAYIGNKAAS
jgi:hypothetical protein